ncbi:MAG: tetratricopeptide repeat protein [Chloroflexi bacterium]|nr:tetratricopeptide repeat protein [Chloroflexota bacterium]
MFNSNDYPKDKLYRAEKMRAAQRDHLAKEALTGKEPEFDLRAFVQSHVRAIVVGLVMLIALGALVFPQISQAKDTAEAGTDEPFAEAITAYRVGHYYYVVGQYDRAIAYYTEAIDGIPAIVFEKADAYRVMYWDMGDALLMAGRYDEALASYRHFVELMDGAASAKAIEFVERLEDGIGQEMVNLTPLTG